jgi:peptidoglycan/LPS O-acetylase OafA/YrhL
MNGLRGLAALAVVGFHWSFREPLMLDHAYLAVDLFFVLSGFVIAHAYAAPLHEGMAPGRFLALRLARLYPLYALGLLLGIVVMVSSIIARRGLTGFTSGSLASMPFAMLMLPAVPGAEGTKHALYPLDIPAWSLFFELLANVGYAMTIRFWTRSRLLLVMLAFAAVLVLDRDVLDGGWNWPTFHIGLARVLFSYTTGVFLFSLHERGWRMPAVHWSLVLGLLLLLLLAPWQVGDLPVVLVGFPLVVALAANCEPQGFADRSFALLGAASYALYTLHEPAHTLVAGLLTHFGVQVGLEVDVPMLMVMVAACVFIARHFDAPLHRYLAQQVNRRF